MEEIDMNKEEVAASDRALKKEGKRIAELARKEERIVVIPPEKTDEDARASVAGRRQSGEGVSRDLLTEACVRQLGADAAIVAGAAALLVGSRSDAAAEAIRQTAVLLEDAGA